MHVKLPVEGRSKVVDYLRTHPAPDRFSRQRSRPTPRAVSPYSFDHPKGRLRMMMTLRFRGGSIACAILLATAAPAALHAQVGATTDIITGVVTDSAGRPLAEASVEALSLETQITRRQFTDQRGRYTIVFPDGGGQYRMTARLIGMAPHTATVMRQADEDRLVWNVKLGTSIIELEAVTIRGARRPVRHRPPVAQRRGLLPRCCSQRLPAAASGETVRRR